MGRKKLKEKLDRSKKAGIISDWEESEQKYTYKYNKGKKSNQKSESWLLNMLWRRPRRDDARGAERWLRPKREQTSLYAAMYNVTERESRPCSNSLTSDHKELLLNN